MNELVEMAKELARLQALETIVGELLVRHNLFVAYSYNTRRFELTRAYTGDIPELSQFRQYTRKPDEGEVLHSSRHYTDCIEAALTRISELAGTEADKP